MSSEFIKDDADLQLSQTPHECEDQSSKKWPPANVPVQMSQSYTSGSSGYSSEYWSDNSVNSQPSCPEVFHMRLPNKSKKEGHNNLTTTLPVKSLAISPPIQISSPTAGDDKCKKHSSIESLKSSSTKRIVKPSNENCNNTAHSSLQKHSLSPEPSSKKKSMIPKPSIARPSGASKSYHLLATTQQSAVKDPELVLQLCALVKLYTCMHWLYITKIIV